MSTEKDISIKDRHDSMRGWFAAELYSAMARNKDIYLLVGDLGYMVFDKIRGAFPERFINTGASEQALLDISVGMAYEGKIPFVYTITPFFYRGFETIRTYINHEELNVKLIGSGRDDDYRHDGFSHDATDVFDLLCPLSNIKQIYPANKEEIPLLIKETVESKQPTFISLTR